MPKPKIYPHFLVFESVDKSKPVSSQSVFLVSKFLEAIIDNCFEAKKQQRGEVLVEVETQRQSTILLKQTRTADLEIRVIPHRSLNKSEGVISEADLISETDTDLLEGVRDQGVTAVKRISIRPDEN